VSLELWQGGGGGEFERVFMKGMEGRAERDRWCLDDLELRKVVVDSMREAFREGSEGPECGLYGEWGFGLEEVDGRGDVNAPFGMAEKVAGLIKGCEFRAVEEEMHMSLPVHYLEDIVRDLLEL